MSHSPTTGHTQLRQTGVLKRKRDYGISEDERDSESMSDNVADSVLLSVVQDINNEVDLEVAIRERLASTIEGRIQWALQLLSALSRNEEPQTQPFDADDFQDAALDAFEAFDAPSAFIFDTELPEEPSLSPRSFSPLISNQQPLQRIPKTRPARTPKPSQQKKLLYIKLPSGTSDSQLAILSCPICSATQFTTLQGLLNHARLAHGIEWASHDACITACATPISADDQNWEAYEQDGMEVPWGGNRISGAEASPQSSTPTQSTLLSRTLGLHADSPALAQFLGRAPKRRCIHVYDEGQDVDILNVDRKTSQHDEIVSEEGAKARTDFRMRYPHRNTAREDLDLMVDVKTEGATEGVNVISNAGAVPANSTASRFHITARVRLEDRSLYLSDTRRAELTSPHQYRWMLVVTAPSYSLPLASFLSRVTVVPPRTTSPVSLSVQQQPFAVIGTANEPFLLKSHLNGLVAVQWKWSIGLIGNPPPLPSLDRNFPAHQIASQPDSSGNSGITTVSEEHMKPRTNVRVPYKLVASPAHLLALVPGRRKAIEWARARALHALYVERTSASSPSQQTSLTVGDVYVFLEDASLFPRPSLSTTATAEPKKKGKEKDGTPMQGEEICPICGIKKRVHPGYDVKIEEAVIHWSCVVVPSSEQRRGTRLPLINLLNVLSWHDGLERAIHGPQLALPFTTGSSSTSGFNHPNKFPSTFRFTPRDLVTLSSPELVLAVQNCIDRLCLPRFLNSPSHGSNRAFLESREQTERSLAPAALLSATLKPFISTLLCAAVEVAKRDVTVLSGASGDRVRDEKWSRKEGQEDRCAGNGVADTGYFRPVSSTEAVALCLARVGVPLGFGRILAADPDAHAADHEDGHVMVKAEPE
ncbi:hypothetical protein BU15DRAFT_60382 [Melanogaster broomeanus]|nr:hypothetical protein BU15DRAFT_60382 [Melanogaster broomeanus]